MKRRLAAWATAALLTTLLSGCGQGGFSDKKAAGAESTLTVAINTSPTTLDPGRVQDVDTSGLLQDVYEGLVSYNEQNELVGQLAESWEVSPDGKTYTFTLRSNAKFHNGDPVTAADVVWTLNRNASKAVNSPTAEAYLGDIEGFAAVYEGKAEAMSGVKALDDRRVEIRIVAPRAYFLGKLAYPVAHVLRSTAVKNVEIKSPEESVGTGPFRLAAYTPDQEVELAAFEDYYLGAPKVKQLRRPVIKDPSTRLSKFRNGELDTLNLERQDIPAAEADPKTKPMLRIIPRPAIFYIGLNQEQYAPFKDRRVRRAFAMAFDRKSFAEETMRLPFAAGLLPPGIPGYRADLAAIPFDPKAARALLAEAGYGPNRPLPPVTFQYRGDRPDSQLLASAAATAFQRNLDLTVETRGMEWRSFLEARNDGAMALYGLSWYADYLDPQNFLSLLLAGNAPQNFDGYRNPQVDGILAEADAKTDPETRWPLYQRAEDLLLEDVARIPVYFGADPLLVQPRVQGLQTNLFGVMPYRNVTLSAAP